jgi:hypothetical protein
MLFEFIAYSGVQHILCCVFVLFFFVLCTLCCQFLWIVKPGVNSSAREGQAVPASYKTLAMLLIYTVKSGKSLGSDKEKKTST